MSPWLLALVAVLVVGAGLAAGVISVRYADSTLRLGVGRSGVHAVAYDLTEGLGTYLLMLALAGTLLALVGASEWVPGSGAFIGFGLMAMLVTIFLAKISPRGTTYWLAVETIGVASIFLATSTHHAANLAADFRDWVLAVRADRDMALLVAMALAVWLGAAWTAFWVLRRRQATVGLAPMAIGLTIEIFNDPGQKNAYIPVSAWIIFAVVLLLRQNLARLRRRWAGRDTDDLPVSLGVHGGRALVVLLFLAFLVPPLTTVDLSTRLFVATRPPTGGGPHIDRATKGGIGSSFFETGYSERVAPSGALTRSHDPVFQVVTDADRDLYWRGIDLYAEDNGTWEVGRPLSISAVVPAAKVLSADQFQATRHVHATVRVLGVPQDTIFWPGEPLQASMRTRLRGDTGNAVNPAVALASVDGAYSEAPLPTGASYQVDAVYSTATEDQLRRATGPVPEWVTRLTSRVAAGSAGTVLDPRVQRLAVDVTAAQTDEYDRVKAIETYLRTHFQYTLDVQPPPPGANPVSYFLFQTQRGYCEYFASAMGELVRALGIPVRLVNGYGAGFPIDSLDTRRVLIQGREPAGAHVITAGDAHTWVEAFFPGYGWIPFEPTPDPNYSPILRAPAGQVSPVATPSPQVSPVAPAPLPAAPGGAGAIPVIPVAGLALLAIGAGMLLARAVIGPARPASVAPAWRRLGWLGMRLGVVRAESDTPLEYAHNLAAALPELSGEIRQLGWAQNRDAFSRDGNSGLGAAEPAWNAVRRRLVRTLLLGPWRNLSRAAPARSSTRPQP